MRNRLKLKFQNQARHPIDEEGVYELKYTCTCCGEISYKTEEIIIDSDKIACYVCNCEEGPHLKPVSDRHYYRRIEQ